MTVPADWLHPPHNLGGGSHAATLALARIGGGIPDGVSSPGAAAGEGWRHPVIAVWLVFVVSLLSLTPDFTGPLDLTIAEHVMAGERFLFVPALVAWSLAAWWGGRRSDEERGACQYGMIWAFLALVTAPLSFEWGSSGWLWHQVSVGMLQLLIVAQLWQWSRFAGIERIGAIILTCGATAELLIFIAVQSGGWDAACAAGLGLTCLEGPFATNAPAALELLGLIIWTSWLLRQADRGGA